MLNFMLVKKLGEEEKKKMETYFSALRKGIDNTVSHWSVLRAYLGSFSVSLPVSKSTK